MAVDAAVEPNRGPCRCMGDAEWTTAQRWSVKVAGELLGLNPTRLNELPQADGERFEDLSTRILEIIWWGWPCDCDRMLPVEAKRPEVSGGGLRKVRTVVEAWLARGLEERAVLDVLRYVAGDHGRRAAAGTPYTARAERVVGRLLADIERDTAVVLINGVAAKKHRMAARWATREATDYELAQYVADRVRPRRGKLGPRSVDHPLGATSVDDISGYVSSAREALSKADPARWREFVALSRAVLTGSTSRIDPDGAMVDAVDDGRAKTLDGSQDYVGMDAAMVYEKRERDAIERLLHEIPSIDYLERLLDALGVLPTDCGARAKQMKQVKRAWERMLRCDERESPDDIDS